MRPTLFGSKWRQVLEEMLVTSSGYYSNVRHDVLSLIPYREVTRALEIGGGDFDTLLSLRKKQSVERWGVDVRPTDAALDKFVLGSITDPAVHQALPDQAFDVILANDVIEHVVDTETFIRVLSDKLTPGGIVAISVPNARQIRFAYHVFMRGHFPRTDAGLFDRTHLRWFCKRDVRNIFEEAGFTLVDAKSTGRVVPSWMSRTKLAEFLALQNIFCFTKVR